jgi:hypothetical protein
MVGGWKLLSAIRKKRYLVWNFGDRPSVFSASGKDVYIIDFLRTLIAKDQDRNVTRLAPLFPPEAKTDNAFPCPALFFSSRARARRSFFALGFKKPEAVRDGGPFSLGVAERAVSAV